MKELYKTDVTLKPSFEIPTNSNYRVDNGIHFLQFPSFVLKIKEKRVDDCDLIYGNKLTMPIVDIVNTIKDLPPQVFLIPGVKENSFGFVFGPPKSGKTVYLETLLLHIAAGRETFMGYPITCNNRRCLFISFEEGGKRDRYQRNQNQLKCFTEEELVYIKENYHVSCPAMPTHLVGTEEWSKVERAIEDLRPGVLALDSLNRLTADSLAEEEIAKEITKRLMDLVKKYRMTLFVINHTTKSSNEGIQTFASMSGSRIYTADSDFAIAVNRISTNARYTKLVYSRYDKDDCDRVDQFEISDNQIVQLKEQVTEYSLFQDADTRIDNSNMHLVWDEVIKFTNSRSSKEFRFTDLKHLYADEDAPMTKPTYILSLKKLMERGKLVKAQFGKGKYVVNG